VVASIADALKTGSSFSTIGVASFGPLHVECGCLGNTPLQNHFPEATIILETHVNAPAHSEYLALSAKSPDTRAVSYLTVGTGVGLGHSFEAHCFSGHMKVYPML
jgi:predicted NBD/HSP70 family sugar kinase